MNSITAKEATTNFRRSTRIQTDVLVEVRNEDFAYAGETISVSMHGALIRTSAQLPVGTSVSVHVHRTGKSALARVVFATSGTGSAYGIEFEYPANIWGLTASPLDWNSLEQMW